MKAVILTIPVLMMASLLGCTEQLQVTGPATTTSNRIQAKINNNIFDRIEFEKMVTGPSGKKYFVAGSVDYILSIDGKDYSLSTSLNATINKSGSENSWVISSEKNFKSLLDAKGVGIVSESNDFGYIGKTLAPYRLTLEYTIKNGLITVTDVKVVNATIVDGETMVD